MTKPWYLTSAQVVRNYFEQIYKNTKKRGTQCYPIPKNVFSFFMSLNVRELRFIGLWETDFQKGHQSTNCSIVIDWQSLTIIGIVINDVRNCEVREGHGWSQGIFNGQPIRKWTLHQAISYLPFCVNQEIAFWVCIGSFAALKEANGWTMKILKALVLKIFLNWISLV